MPRGVVKGAHLKAPTTEHPFLRFLTKGVHSPHLHTWRNGQFAVVYGCNHSVSNGFVYEFQGLRVLKEHNYRHLRVDRDHVRIGVAHFLDEFTESLADLPFLLPSLLRSQLPAIAKGYEFHRHQVREEVLRRDADSAFLREFVHHVHVKVQLQDLLLHLILRAALALPVLAAAILLLLLAALSFLAAALLLAALATLLAATLTTLLATFALLLTTLLFLAAALATLLLAAAVVAAALILTAHAVTVAAVAARRIGAGTSEFKLDNALYSS